VINIKIKILFLNRTMRGNKVLKVLSLIIFNLDLNKCNITLKKKIEYFKGIDKIIKIINLNILGIRALFSKIFTKENSIHAKI